MNLVAGKADYCQALSAADVLLVHGHAQQRPVTSHQCLAEKPGPLSQHNTQVPMLPTLALDVQAFLIPLYLGFLLKRQVDWVRSKRDDS